MVVKRGYEQANEAGRNEAAATQRREHAWLQRDLARESGVSQNAIATLELGQREAQPRTVRRLAAALGVELRKLMEGSNDAYLVLPATVPGGRSSTPAPPPTNKQGADTPSPNS